MRPTSLTGLDDADLRDVLSRIAPLEGDLRCARILLTGATGWFGIWLLDVLVALERTRSPGLRVVAMSRDPQAFARCFPVLHAAACIEWLVADVRDPLVGLAGPFTHIIHGATAASAKLNAEQPDLMFETVVSGTTQVLRLAASHPGCKVLLLSSGAVYGVQPPDLARLDETYRGAPDMLDPANAYAEGKRVAELLASIWHATEGVHVAIARCFTFVGPHMPFDAHFAVGNFMRDALDGEAISLSGDGTPRRSYLYMTDLMVWLFTILVDGKPLRPYNVGADLALSIAALADTIVEVSGLKIPVALGKNHAGTDYVPDISRARDELGLRVTVDLREAIARTLAWKQRQGMRLAA